VDYLFSVPSREALSMPSTDALVAPEVLVTSKSYQHRKEAYGIVKMQEEDIVTWPVQS
jgi:hypothetical protein